MCSSSIAKSLWFLLPPVPLSLPPSSGTPYQARKIPLEIAVTEDKLPMYSTTTEDDGRGYAATKLPFQVCTGIVLAVGLSWSAVD